MICDVCIMYFFYKICMTLYDNVCVLFPSSKIQLFSSKVKLTFYSILNLKLLAKLKIKNSKFSIFLLLQSSIGLFQNFLSGSFLGPTHIDQSRDILT